MTREIPRFASSRPIRAPIKGIVPVMTARPKLFSLAITLLPTWAKRAGKNILIAYYDAVARRLSRQPRENREALEGFVQPISVAPGEPLSIRVHSTRPTFNISLERLGLEEEVVKAFDELPGRAQQVHEASFREGANWESAVTLTVPETWHTGLYVAHLSHEDGTHFNAPFVVKPKPDDRNELLVIASTNTWQAYNDWGGASLYRDRYSRNPYRSWENIVNLDRPNPAADPIDGEVHLARGERFILAWLEREGFSYGVISDHDLHRDPDCLAGCNVLVLNTHAEYWTSEMLERLKAFLARGGSILNLSGNSLYWKTVIRGSRMEVQKKGTLHRLSFELGGLWADRGQPEAALLGVHYTPDDYMTFAPYKVLLPDHWAFAGTGLKAGDLIGKVGFTGGAASGWETDKIDEHSPTNIEVLAKGVNPSGGADMTYLSTSAGGHVFSASSIAFGGSLIVDEALSRIVCNVLAAALSKVSTV